MRTSLLLILGFILVSCRSPLPSESFRQTQNDAHSSSSGELIDFTNEATPSTPDSLEVIHQPIASIPVTVSSKQSIILGDAGSGTVRGKNPPTLTVIMDYSCEFCREEALTLRPWILSSYVAPHTLNVELQFAPQSALGSIQAKAALCAAELGFFKDMDEYLLFTPTIDAPAIAKFAQQNGVKASTWKYCMEATVLADAPTLPDGSLIERLPAFILGNDSWIGVERERVVKEKIEGFLKGK